MTDFTVVPDVASAIGIIESDRIVATLKDGRIIEQIDEDSLSGELYFQFQRMAVKYKTTPDEAMRWLMLKLFLVDGKPMNIDHLNEKPPIGLGFRAIATLGTKTSEFVQGLPDPKESSGEANTLAGE